MTPGQIKGSLLEYLVRLLLQNCGFTPVKPDGHYIYQQNGTGLFLINGKGAAHDADVLMEPPIQLPFSYPTRILFECKAYKTKIGLDTVRNALGLRYDINEFEIITDESIQRRKNNQRESYAISDRVRYNYQVGIASTEHFSASAFEFAANNKIPLLSLKWLLTDSICSLFHEISDQYIKSIPFKQIQEIYGVLKNKSLNHHSNRELEDFIQSDPIIGQIIRVFRQVLMRSFVALTETGDLIFIFAERPSDWSMFINTSEYGQLKAQIHYSRENPDLWLLDLHGANNNRISSFRFFVPEKIMKYWKQFSLDRSVAIDIKERFFSRIFIFINPRDLSYTQRPQLPFVTVNIDTEWLDRIREQ